MCIVLGFKFHWPMFSKGYQWQYASTTTRVWRRTGWVKIDSWNDVAPTWASCQIRKIASAHAPGMPGTFSPPPRVSDPDMHHGTCVTHVPWCMPGSLTSGFLWSRWRGKTFRHSRRMRNLQFYVSGKRPMAYKPLLEPRFTKSLWYSTIIVNI